MGIASGNEARGDQNTNRKKTMSYNIIRNTINEETTPEIAAALKLAETGKAMPALRAALDDLEETYSDYVDQGDEESVRLCQDAEKAVAAEYNDAVAA